MTDDDERPLRWLIQIIFYYFVVSLISFAFMIVAATWWLAHAEDCQEGAYGCGHQENHEKYKNWNARPMSRDGKPTKDGNCCNGEDCRPVRARQGLDGGWEFWLPEWGKWVAVPQDAVDQPDRFHDGRSHACTSTLSPLLPGNIRVYCFSPAQQKS